MLHGVASVERMHQWHRSWRWPTAGAAVDAGAAVEAAIRAAIERVHVIVVDTSAALVDCLNRLEETMIRLDAKLIVVDSMA